MKMYKSMGVLYLMSEVTGQVNPIVSIPLASIELVDGVVDEKTKENHLIIQHGTQRVGLLSNNLQEDINKIWLAITGDEIKTEPVRLDAGSVTTDIDEEAEIVAFDMMKELENLSIFDTKRKS